MKTTIEAIYDKWFARYGWADDIPDKLLVARTTSPVVPPELNPDFVGDIIDKITPCTHGQTILIPYPGSELMAGLRRYSGLYYWMIEPDKDIHEALFTCDDCENGPGHNEQRYIYQVDTIWNMNPEQWVDEYDLEVTQANALYSFGPLNTATMDFLFLYEAIKQAGNVCGIIPYNDLFANDEEGKLLRKWLADHWIEYAVLRDKAAGCQRERLAFLHGRRIWWEPEPEVEQAA